MRIEIIRQSGDLKREVWVFTFFSDWSKNGIIYFDDYRSQSKETLRKRNWTTDWWWSRLSRRERTLQEAPLPADVEAEMRLKFKEIINNTPIQK